MKSTMPKTEQPPAPSQPHQVVSESPFSKTNSNEMVTEKLKSWLQHIPTKKPLVWRRLNALAQTNPSNKKRKNASQQHR